MKGEKERVFAEMYRSEISRNLMKKSLRKKCFPDHDIIPPGGGTSIIRLWYVKGHERVIEYDNSDASFSTRSEKIIVPHSQTLYAFEDANTTI